MQSNGGKRRAPWNETHRNLDRALAACGLSPCEQMLMVRAREESYTEARLRGLPDPIPFKLNISQEAKAFGVNRTAMQLAQGRLIKAGIWTKKGRMLAIDKDYRSWMPPHKLTEEQARFADEAMDLGKDRPNRCRSATDRTFSVTDRQQQLLLIGNRECNRSATPSVVDRQQVHPPPPDPPIEERTRVLKREERMSVKRGDTPQGDPPGGETGKLQSEEFIREIDEAIREAMQGEAEDEKPRRKRKAAGGR